MSGLRALPPDVVSYKRTRTFTEKTIPPGLTKQHRTKSGVWAKIVVESGVLRFRTLEPDVSVELTPDRPGVVEPEAPHEVAPAGPVRFFVEFFRRPGASP